MDVYKFCKRLERECSPPFMPEGFVKVVDHDRDVGFALVIGNRDLQFDPEGGFVGSGSRVGEDAGGGRSCQDRIAPRRAWIASWRWRLQRTPRRSARPSSLTGKRTGVGRSGGRLRRSSRGIVKGGSYVARPLLLLPLARVWRGRGVLLLPRGGGPATELGRASGPVGDLALDLAPGSLLLSAHERLTASPPPRIAGHRVAPTTTW